MTVVLTREQVRRVDRLAVEQYAMTGLVLMENAGRNAAAIIHDAYGPTGDAILFCGTGNNGGDGFVIARHLHNLGWRVRLVLTGSASSMTYDTAANCAIIRAMDLPLMEAADADRQRTAVGTVQPSDVVVDSLLGTGFRGDVRSPMAELIDKLNSTNRRAMVSVDVPSGLDCDDGLPSNATIRADLTITFVASKTGFSRSVAAPYTGRVEVVDIGTPRELIDRVRNSKA